MKDVFDKDICEGTLLVVNTNAFNCVNYQAALHNISIPLIKKLHVSQLLMFSRYSLLMMPRNVCLHGGRYCLLWDLTLGISLMLLRQH